MAGEVTLRATLARPYLAATTTPQVAYALIEVQPSAVMAQVRTPVNVSFVLDRSGSMKGDKIDRVRQAIALAVDRLDAQDIASLVIFDHRTEVLIPAGPVTDRRMIKDRVSRIRDAGGTKIAPAVEKGLREIEKDRSGAIRRLVLLTDGQTESEDDCLRRADDAGRIGVPITALGVGQDWNEDLLIEMANRSGGTADYIARADEITEYFQNTVQRAQNSAIQNSALNLRLVQGVTPRAVWQVIPLINNLGYKPISDRDVSVTLGELETGQGRTLLVEFLVDPRPIGSYRVGQVEITYDIPALNVVGEKARIDIMLTFTADQAQLNQVTPNVMNIVEKVSAFKLQTRALQDLQSGDVGSATQKLKSAVTRLLNQGEVDLANTMQQEIANLEQNGQLSSEGQKTIKFSGRKTVRLSDIDIPKE
ncbi:vWA domain-containing protein [Candidatus Oscillochloris fontis]|uniref:vWA domain-containing protein n=1 Tax=Candidatus Oscillochloris fontis TaxID=2496868 RepID=UPI00101BCD33|nr:VWA domain-containing protein [Candidatus Oscillochloris fontis]